MALNVFDYTDYRNLLRDFYEQQKKKNAKFSHRYIAQKVGFSSSSFFSQVIKVQSNISDRLIFSFAKFMKLNKRETEYFELLVKYNQAKSHEEKKFFFEKLLNFRRPETKKLQAGQYQLLNKWYHIAIRQIIAVLPFRGDYKELAKTIVPAISPAEAKRGVQLLKDLDLIRKNAQGYYEWNQPSITTGSDSSALGLQTYILQTMDLGRDALDRFEKKERDLSTLTLSISGQGLIKALESIRQFRKELLELAENDSEVDRVYHLNMQFFPMSKVVQGRSP